MDSDEGAQAPEVQHQRGWTPHSWAGRVASALGGAAVSTVAWGVATTLRVAILATGLAVRASERLAGRASQALGSPVGAAQELSEEVNRALVLRLYRAAVQTDLVTVQKLFAEDVTWWVPDPEPAAGRYRGVATTAPALVSIWRRIGPVHAVELRDVVASRERAAALLRVSAVQEGQPVTLDWWVIFRIDGGQITQAWGPFTPEPDGAEPPGNQAHPDGTRARKREP